MIVQIVKKEVKTYIQHAMCECGGEMVESGRAIVTLPLNIGGKGEYEHKCNRCGKTVKLPQKYPNNVQEEI